MIAMEKPEYGQEYWLDGRGIPDRISVCATNIAFSTVSSLY